MSGIYFDVSVTMHSLRADTPEEAARIFREVILKEMTGGATSVEIQVVNEDNRDSYHHMQTGKKLF